MLASYSSKCRLWRRLCDFVDVLQTLIHFKCWYVRLLTKHDLVPAEPSLNLFHWTVLYQFYQCYVRFEANYSSETDYSSEHARFNRVRVSFFIISRVLRGAEIMPRTTSDKTIIIPIIRRFNVVIMFSQKIIIKIIIGTVFVHWKLATDWSFKSLFIQKSSRIYQHNQLWHWTDRMCIKIAVRRKCRHEDKCVNIGQRLPMQNHTKLHLSPRWSQRETQSEN